MLRNSNAAGFGGMLTFLAVTGTTSAPDTMGPVTSNVAYSAGTLTAIIDDTATGGSAIAAAEYFIDNVGATGAGAPMSGGFGSPSTSVSASVAVPPGAHTLYVHGLDSAGNWGTVASVLTNGGDATGPTTSGLTLNPSPTNGAVDVALHANGDDSATGGSNIDAAEYFIGADPGPGAATAMTVNIVAPTASLDTVIAAATVNGLSEGVYVVSVRSHDAAGNWGAPATINLIVDKTGPATSGVTAAPNPNNGQLPFDSTNPVVRVTAAFADTTANISAAEGFIDTQGANGSGFIFTASDGAFNSLTENGYVDIPLTTIVQLSAGNHTIYVHAKDAAGNWGAAASYTLVIDKTAPTVVSITTLNANPTSAATVQFLVTFSENVSGVASGNFTLAQGGGLTGATITAVTGSGTSWTVTASTGTGGGTLGLNLTSASGIKDSAGNVLSTAGLPFVGQTYTVVSPPLYFSTFGNSNPPGVGGSADDADIYFWSGSAFSRAIDASAAPYNLPSSGGGNANVDGFERVDATHFYMSFTGQVNVPGIGNVQDED
ncbi:MAG: hypothetical protein KDE50_31480, partial [Caldilineaceae bacterium]|nr:hypothetical protein [Caldilineaceae bacterium]